MADVAVPLTVCPYKNLVFTKILAVPRPYIWGTNHLAAMRTFETTPLLQGLAAEVATFRALAQAELAPLPTATLLQSPGPGQWSLAQILEHLNSYGQYYLPALASALAQAPPARGRHFTSGWLGDYFARSMQPGPQGQINNPMKALKGHRPGPHLPAQSGLETFVAQQTQLLALLHQAEGRDLAAQRIGITLTPLIRLKTGDVFRFLVAHQTRHFWQAKRALAAVRQPTEVG
jgi:DinB superfamily